MGPWVHRLIKCQPSISRSAAKIKSLKQYRLTKSWPIRSKRTAEDQVPLEGGDAKTEHGGTLSFTGIGVGVMLRWRVLDVVRLKMVWWLKGSLPGLLRVGEASGWARGDVLLLHFEATGGGFLRRAFIQGQGRTSTRGLRRCFSTRRLSSGGYRVAWRWWRRVSMGWRGSVREGFGEVLL
jgi:hypothetical protein